MKNSGSSCFATESCDPDQGLYIHISHAGEKVYLGFNANGLTYISFKISFNGFNVYSNTVNLAPGSQGYIHYHSQALAGPDILNPHGYPALIFSPPHAGDYRIDFVLPSSAPTALINLFDITVTDTTKTPLVPIPGRLWSKDWSFQALSLFVANMYILATDSIVTSINYNQMAGMVFDVTSTRNGCYPLPYPWDSSCMSRPDNHHYAEYKLFLNDPDPIEYPTGTMGVILGDTVNITRACDGSFTFKFLVNKPGIVKLNIESNLAPGIQSEDLTVNHDVVQGLNTIFWDGLNALGQPVPCGDSVEISIEYINGLTNIALYDVESHAAGFIIQLVRPAGPPVASYWNDTLLAALGGQVQLAGCYPTLPDTGCHCWGEGGIGNLNTVNTWWYASSSLLNPGRFRVPCVPHTPEGITGPLTMCASSLVTYRVNPNPVPGSETLGYEWILTDVTSGVMLFDSLNTGPSVDIHFSSYPPGQKRLKVRGRSDLCGTGPFGPGVNGEGILINPLVTTQIINPIRYFPVCSGDTTDLLIQASMAGTSYSYTATSSSPSITGYSSGVQNPINQVLVNSGSHADTVIYRIVPYLDPCQGDTAIFMVVIYPSDSLGFLITASANPGCEGAVDTFSVASLIGGPTASYQWQVNKIPAGSNAPVFCYIPANGDTVECSIHSSLFCTPGNMAYSQEIIMNILPAVSADISITPSVSPVCQGDPVTLTATSINGGSSPHYHWQVNGSGTGTDTSYLTYIPEDGDRVICVLTSDLPCVLNNPASDTIHLPVKESLQIIDTSLCSGTPYFAQGAWQTSGGTYFDTLAVPLLCVRFIETHLTYKPSITVDLGRDTTLCGNTITLNASFPGSTYLWQDGSTDSIYVVSFPGNYRVQVEYDGCVYADSITIEACRVILWFPNAFTPNGDGLNDTFHPAGIGIEKFSMQIFNRWGIMVFDTGLPDPGWDGNYQGTPCPEGVYVYKASFEGSDGETRQVTGTITLYRGGE